VIAVADAIAYAHGRNIIHRDLKPANVIVGEFGETVVIDWGLAKDVSASDDTAGPERSAGGSDNELTQTGSVLGTPAYMAPEQERGEHVDQRADVFAIGAMLWELGSLQRVPPSTARERRRTLRQAGIDGDLATIIDKALDPEPARRYPDAGALAADLKAFKSGARIAARSYSLFAMLAHWTRRHRALALSVIGIIATSIIAGAWFVRNIATERDRADTALARMEVANDDLTIEHAELLLHTDPTAAFELLETYHGRDAIHRALLRAKARGLGVAQRHVTPHDHPIVLARVLGDGSVLTLSTDATIAKTDRRGASRVVARKVTPLYIFDYAELRHLLAYACDPAAICLLDGETEQLLPTSDDMRAFAPVAVALSPAGDWLAALSTAGQLAIWQLSPTERPAVRYQGPLPDTRALQFVDERTVMASSLDRVRILHLDDAGGVRAISADLPVAGLTDTEVSAEHRAIVVGTSRGELVMIDAERDAIAGRNTACSGNVARVFVFAGSRGVGYACSDGDAGVWDQSHDARTVVAHLDEGASQVAGSADGRYLMVGGANGRLVIYDFEAHIVHSDIGHHAAITAIVPPSPASAFIVSADASGAVRMWAPPNASARAVIHAPGRLNRTTALPDDAGLVAQGQDSTVLWYTFDGRHGQVSSHSSVRRGAAASPTEPRIAMYGTDDEVELWSFDRAQTESPLDWRSLHTGHGVVTAAEYTADGTQLIVGSRDGAITAWSSDGVALPELGTIGEPISSIRSIPRRRAVAVIGAHGAVWYAEPGSLRQLATEVEPIAHVAISGDARWIALGTSRGSVHVYELATGRAAGTWTFPVGIELVAFAPDSAQLGVATQKGVSLVAMTGTPSAARSVAPLAAGALAFSRDNRWLAILCDDESLWFYDRNLDHWHFLSLGSGHLGSGRFSDDSARFIATDATGRSLVIDMRTSTFE
jgi:WD40 repeat protein